MKDLRTVMLGDGFTVVRMRGMERGTGMLTDFAHRNVNETCFRPWATPRYDVVR